MLQLKYKGKQIRQMNEQELDLWPTALILKVHVIMGWVINEGPLQDVLTDQFKKKLIEDYGNMTTEEIEYAFRRAVGIKDYGKSMNLELLDQVLRPYMNERIRLGHEVEERRKPVKEISYTEEQLLDFKRMWTEEFYQRQRAGFPEDIPPYTVEILLHDNLIESPDQAPDFIAKKLGMHATAIYQKRE